MAAPENTIAQTAAPTITLNFLYQLIGQKEVELAVMREQVVALRAEVSEVRSVMATMMHDAGAVGDIPGQTRQDLADMEAAP